MTPMKPFWHYYGGKFRASWRYPHPRERLVIEPFAGAAGYATRHHDLNVLLIDKSPIIAGIWAYLIRTPASEIRTLPTVGEGGVDDVAWPCDEAKWLAGFWLDGGVVSPRKLASLWGTPGICPYSRSRGWAQYSRSRVASQVDRIRHWRVICGDYTEAPDVPATWFIDPPYNNRAGRHYPHHNIDYGALGEWCRRRNGTVIVCENAGADWMQWTDAYTIKSKHSLNRPSHSHEVAAIRDAPLFDWRPQNDEMAP